MKFKRVVYTTASGDVYSVTMTQLLDTWVDSWAWNEFGATRYSGDLSLLQPKYLDECILDPGGCVCMDTDAFEFEIEGYKFQLKPEHYMKVRYLLQDATRKGDITLTSMYNTLLVLPLKVHQGVTEVLARSKMMMASYKEVSEIIAKHVAQPKFHTVYTPVEIPEA